MNESSPASVITRLGREYAEHGDVIRALRCLPAIRSWKTITPPLVHSSLEEIIAVRERQLADGGWFEMSVGPVEEFGPDAAVAHVYTRAFVDGQLHSGTRHWVMYRGRDGQYAGGAFRGRQEALDELAAACREDLLSREAREPIKDRLGVRYWGAVGLL